MYLISESLSNRLAGIGSGRLLLLPRGLRMLMVLTCYRSLLYNLWQTGSDLYKFMKSQSKPYAVHNTPKPICTLALNSSQTCEIFLPRACDLAWSESVRVVSEGDCMFLTCSAQAAWAHQHGCWERDEGSEAEQYRDVGLCVCVCSCTIVSTVRGGEGDGGRTEWEEEAVQYMRVFLWGTSRLVLPRRRPGEHARKQEGGKGMWVKQRANTKALREWKDGIHWSGSTIRRACGWAGEAATTVVDGCDVLTPRFALGFIIL